MLVGDAHCSQRPDWCLGPTAICPDMEVVPLWQLAETSAAHVLLDPLLSTSSDLLPQRQPPCVQLPGKLPRHAPFPCTPELHCASAAARPIASACLMLASKLLRGRISALATMQPGRSSQQRPKHCLAPATPLPPHTRVGWQDHTHTHAHACELTDKRVTIHLDLDCTKHRRLTTPAEQHAVAACSASPLWTHVPALQCQPTERRGHSNQVFCCKNLRLPGISSWRMQRVLDCSAAED